MQIIAICYTRNSPIVGGIVEKIIWVVKKKTASDKFQAVLL